VSGFDPDFFSSTYIVEEFISGKEVSVEGVVAKGKIHIVGITEKWADSINFTEYQHTFPARLPEAVVEDIYKVTRKGIEALELDNCGFHAELIITDHGSKIIEVAGRLGGDFITTHLIPMQLKIFVPKFVLPKQPRKIQISYYWPALKH
jgi:biotin carboxylase